MGFKKDPIERISKILKKFYKKLIKSIDKISIKQYLNDDDVGGVVYHFIGDVNNMSFTLSSDIYQKRLKRETIRKALIETNFVKTDKEWSCTETVAFYDLVFDTYLSNYSEKRVEANEKLISKMFSIPENRIKSTISIMLRNLEKYGDKLGIYNYFSLYEIVQFKYRDLDNLQELVELNDVPEEELKIVKEIYGV